MTNMCCMFSKQDCLVRLKLGMEYCLKKKVLVLLVLYSFSSIAQTNTELYKNIANSFDSLLSDTVNEGDMTVRVSQAGGAPDMTCRLSPYREQGKGLAKCEVMFNIETDFTDEAQHCRQRCFLIHIYNLKTLQIISRVESLEQACLENISSGCE